MSESTSIPPYKLRDGTLQSLRSGLLAMTSPQFLLALERRSDETKADAAKTLLQIQHARIKLANEELANIRDRLIENEEDLKTGIDGVSKALKNLSAIKGMLEAVNSLLGAVARVVTLL